MKLRNKRTGEIGELQITEKYCAVEVGNGTASGGIEIYSSLTSLNEEWEDVAEEPKEYWCIREDGVVEKRPYPIIIECAEQEYRDAMREIGNYFETKEEAEKAVEKLKAWKRLKDKGFMIRRNNYNDGMMYLHIWNDTTDESTSLDKNSETFKDLDLLFGGEE